MPLSKWLNTEILQEPQAFFSAGCRMQAAPATRQPKRSLCFQASAGDWLVDVGGLEALPEKIISYGYGSKLGTPIIGWLILN